MSISKSLQNLEFYNDALTNVNTLNVVRNYCKLLREYMIFIYEKKEIKENDNSNYLICRGIYTINHIFQQVFLYTKNVDVAMYHAEKSIYYYVEFIEQIMAGSDIYLYLTSKDATLFVYKKIINDINLHVKKNISYTDNETKIINTIFNTNQLLINLLVYFVNSNNDLFKDFPLYKTTIKRIIKSTDKVVNSKIFKNGNINKINDLCELIKVLITKNIELVKITGIINEYIKTIDTHDICKQQLNEKICSLEFDHYTKNKTHKFFVKWLCA
jgi:hypothetical protein